MISVQSLRQLLSGNKLLWLACLLVLFQSCKILSPATTNGQTNGKSDNKEDNLPPIEGTRVYDPVKQQWVTIEKAPVEKMDTLTFADAPSSQIPPITMDGVDAYVGIGDGSSGESFKVSVMLPFMANRIDPDATEISNRVSNWSLQFYAAIKMALADLEDENIGLEVSVFDTEANPSKVENLLYSETALANANVILGPYRRENIRQVAEFAKEQGKVVISPYSASTNLTKDNPNFIQVSPSLSTHCESLIKHATNEFEPEEIVVVARDIPIEKMCLATIQREHFDILGTEFADSLNYLLASSDAQEFFDTEIDEYFETEDKLAFIVPSWADERFVYGLLRKIDLARKEFQRIVVYGMPQWMDFQAIDYEYYEKLNVRVSSNSYVDRNDEAVKSFQRDFYDQYGIIPSDEAFLGYDIMKYLGMMLAKHGTEFVNQLDIETVMPFLHTKFDFQKVMAPNSSAVGLEQVDRYENKYVNILEFNNFAFQPSNN